MPERTSMLGSWIKRFLIEYLPTERNLAINTLKSYRDCLTLLLPFVASRCSKPVERLKVEDLSADRVTAFLGHLETERGCSVQTRNHRLSAIRSFARYVSVHDAALVEWAGSIRAIPLKKTVRPRITWLSTEDMEAMIAGADRRSVIGRVEHAVLLFLYRCVATHLYKYVEYPE
ncbi:MAG: site-specific integrase, partial [Bryobacterales bacterium]|nr:site-specific integrase [Bryobacterales bacterium]